MHELFSRDSVESYPLVYCELGMNFFYISLWLNLHHWFKLADFYTVISLAAYCKSIMHVTARVALLCSQTPHGNSRSTITCYRSCDRIALDCDCYFLLASRERNQTKKCCRWCWWTNRKHPSYANTKSFWSDWMHYFGIVNNVSCWLL